jgi:hypothetical protein
MLRMLAESSGYDSYLAWVEGNDENDRQWQAMQYWSHVLR